MAKITWENGYLKEIEHDTLTFDDNDKKEIKKHLENIEYFFTKNSKALLIERAKYTGDKAKELNKKLNSLYNQWDEISNYCSGISITNSKDDKYIVILQH